MEGYIGEVRMYMGKWAPRGWMFCDGQRLNIREYAPLFSIIGNAFGSDLNTYFNLPDFRGRAPIHRGITDSANYQVGQKIGTETVALTTAQMPAHTHSLKAISAAGAMPYPQDSLIATSDKTFLSGDHTPDVSLSPKTISSEGRSEPHNNMQPSLVTGFIICVEGMYPAIP